jgi:hypothetical protein
MNKTSAELTHELFDLLLRTYEANYGRLIEMPAMGPTRERYEKLMRNFSASVNLYTAWMQMCHQLSEHKRACKRSIKADRPEGYER